MEKDTEYMLRALALAENASFISSPNPAVGCIIVRGNRIIGEGFTQRAGGPHAEVMALRDAQRRGEDVKGATVYVTLEPCSHYGRTPPCALALIKAQVGRVVSALRDPNPLVAGRGLEMLKNAGIEVGCGVCAKEAARRNVGFICRMTENRCYVRSKIAMSLDAKTALLNGKSQWITDEAARRDGMNFRGRAGAILTGSGTVRDDNPQLSVRLDRDVKQPLRVVVDSRMTLPADAAVFRDSNALLVCAAAEAEKKAQFEARGIEVLELAGADGRVDLAALLRELAARGINEVHVEAGPTLNGALARAGLIDELLVYVAPKLLGPGRPMMDLPAVESLDEALEWQWQEVTQVGAAVRMIATLKH
jgi:diaminohydroxyphosphoribosylaminopyrimidine deaminase/5-amino-6-(5-phosphoribosylamino)uracil reductase